MPYNNESYAFVQKRQTLDWNEFLNRKEYTYGDLMNAYMLATSWVTCAVGIQCAIIPRYEGGPMHGMPKDVKLQVLGKAFYRAIDHMDIRSDDDIDVNNIKIDSDVEKARNKAIIILNKIEERSAFLINQINASSGNTIQ